MTPVRATNPGPATPRCTALGLLVLATVGLGCGKGSPKGDGSTQASSSPSESEQVLTLASVPAAQDLRRPSPGTDWARQTDLIGPVKRVTKTTTRGLGEERTTLTATVGFTRHGHRLNAWVDGAQVETGTVSPEGDLIERATAASEDGPASRTTYVGFDESHRVFQKLTSSVSGDSAPVIDQVVTFEYDRMGQVKSYTQSTGTEISDERIEIVSRYTYDAEGDWTTQTTEEGTVVRTLSELDETNKTLETEVSGITATEIVDRSTGRLVSRSVLGTSIENTYTAFDAHGNWTARTTHARTDGGEPEWFSDEVRTIEYFD